jgi:hypothetical protein
MPHKKPRARLQNRLSFELVRDLFTLQSTIRFTAIIAETRQTYRAVLSEPTVIFPADFDLTESSNPIEKPEMQGIVAADRPQPQKRQREDSGPSKKKKRRQNQEGTEVVT